MESLEISLPSLPGKYAIGAVYTNEDHEQYALDRDNRMAGLLRKNGSELKLHQDRVIFSKDEVLKKNRKRYTVFSLYSKVWRATLFLFV